MKINRLETHDRYQEFLKQSQSISAYCESIVQQKPFGEHPFYIFCHKRTLQLDDRYRLWLSGNYENLESVPSYSLIWQPRLTKPKAQTNSMLFKAYPKTNEIKVLWIIPERELWPSYQKEKMTESDIVAKSIWDFQNNRHILEDAEADDLTDESIDSIYRQISIDAKKRSKDRNVCSLTCPPCS